MDRKDFLVTLGKGAAVASIAYCIGCAKQDPLEPTPTNLDVTLDLTQPANQALNTVGGSIVSNGIIVGRTSTNAAIAVAAACTHEGTTIQFQLNNNRFYCPNHGSTYDFNGVVTNGPAAKNLTKFNTSLNGNSLRIFS